MFPFSFIIDSSSVFISLIEVVVSSFPYNLFIGNLFLPFNYNFLIFSHSSLRILLSFLLQIIPYNAYNWCSRSDPSLLLTHLLYTFSLLLLLCLLVQISFIQWLNFTLFSLIWIICSYTTLAILSYIPPTSIGFFYNDFLSINFHLISIRTTSSPLSLQLLR